MSLPYNYSYRNCTFHFRMHHHRFHHQYFQLLLITQHFQGHLRSKTYGRYACNFDKHQRSLQAHCTSTEHATHHVIIRQSPPQITSVLALPQGIVDLGRPQFYTVSPPMALTFTPIRTLQSIQLLRDNAYWILRCLLLTHQMVLLRVKSRFQQPFDRTFSAHSHVLSHRLSFPAIRALFTNDFLFHSCCSSLLFALPKSILFMQKLCTLSLHTTLCPTLLLFQ